MRKDIERKESMSIEDSKKLKTVNTKKITKLFEKIEQEISNKAMPEGGSLFFVLRYPNEGKESQTFMCSLNGVGTEIIKSFAEVSKMDNSFRGMLKKSLELSIDNPIEDFLHELFGK